MAERAQSGGQTARPLVAIGLALTAFALFTFMDTVVKLLGGRYHILQIMLFNSLFGFLSICVIASLDGGLARVRTRRWRLHGLRWCISFAGACCVFWAYTQLPLADVYAILFTAPLLITALSVPILGERVGWRRWTAVATGFLGVIVMLRPGSSAIDIVALVALLGALGHSLNMLIVRKLGQTDAAVSFGFWGNLITLVVIGPIMPLLWRTPDLADLLLLAVGGTLAGGAFWLLATAFRLAPAAVVAPFQYSQMPYGLIVGWLIFGTSPDPWVLIGATIVVASGLYILRREALLVRLARPVV